MARKLIAGNWKMNGLSADGTALASALADRLEAGPAPSCDLLVCPPAPLLPLIKQAIGSATIAVGGQDCHAKESGAHTGDLSARLLADVGCSHVIVGHSERRSDHGESSADVKAKAEAAMVAGLVPIICVGETEEDRNAGRALTVIQDQIERSLPEAGSNAGAFVVAYEPVWAIGTGKTATPQDVAEVHRAIHTLLQAGFGEATAAATNILYGGSVKPDNAAELMAVEQVGGALVGGASLKAEDFWAIARSCP
ncbi:MAG: triose-phosphate isomerase [Pseudomonadota bacterium]